MNKGIWRAVGAYATWGVLPIYWRLIHAVPAMQVLGHRIVWSCALLAVVIFFTRGWSGVRETLFTKRTLLLSAVAALLIGSNWLTYVWSVTNGHIVEASLGYFINPLVTVLFGVLFFRERLRPLQWVSLGIATMGVVYVTAMHGALPWIALTLAITFALYALVKKMAHLGPMHGLAVETSILLIPAVVFLIVIDASGQGAFARGDLPATVLLIGTGAITTIPLLLFASAAQRIPLATVGILQYISPSIQLLIGIMMFGEQFTHIHAIGFGCVWVSLALYAGEQWVFSCSVTAA
jgi:chloramphenicol-sensitive protein RarD